MLFTYFSLLSSHVSQPYGDTLFELLWILPRLKSGVIVHVHDIFLPYDYPEVWTNLDQARQYTEQWVLAAFLYKNQDWKVLWPTYYMSFNNFIPSLEGGGSFWFQRI